MARSIIKMGILALALAAHVNAAEYTLDPSDNYSGANFFNFWDFITVRTLSRILYENLNHSICLGR